MINCDKGIVEIEGSSAIVLAELICVIRSVHEFIEENSSKEEADTKIEYAFTRAKMSSEDLENEIKEKILKIIMGE